jgi:hypothetical protein
MAKNGRPTIYTDELADLICERVATHPVGYNTLMQMFPDMPDSSTVRAWRKVYERFSTRYLEAKAFQAQVLVEDIDDLIPEKINYYLDDKGQERIDSASASLLIAKINNRKWMAARLAPKVYGDKKQEETNTADTLFKIKSLVDDLNKINSSDI